MPRSWRPVVLGCSVLLVSLACGCHLFCRDRPIRVLAKDAETGRPLNGADVKITYSHDNAPLGRSDALAKTAEDGIARLSASPADELGVTVAASAPDYLPEEAYLSAKQIGAIEPAPLLFGAAPAGPPAVVLALYAGPHPTVELVVPDGYRGLVRAEVDAQDDAPASPGRRVFTVAVPASGEVRVTGPALLRRVNSPDFTAKYANGTPLPRGAKDDEVGLWWLKSDGPRHTFLIGTRGEYDSQRPSRGGQGDGAGGPSRSGRGGGGRRGGGRRGSGGGQPS